MPPRRVRELCDEHGTGVKVSDRYRIVTEADLAAISAKRRPRGNPNFGKKKRKR